MAVYEVSISASYPPGNLLNQSKSAIERAIESENWAIQLDNWTIDVLAVPGAHGGALASKRASKQ